jgi:neutral ceramidase
MINKFILKIAFFLCISIFAFYSKASAQTQIKAGAAKINITPPIGTIINGDFLPMYTNVIHDSLYARALAFSNDKSKFVFIVVDIMTLDGDLINEVKKNIEQNTGLTKNQIMISATHAHSCGSVTETATCAADLAYRQWLPAKIGLAAKYALKNLEPAKIAWGNIDVPKHVSCRRWFMKPGFDMISPFGETDKVWMNPPFGSPYLDKPVSKTDPQVTYLAVKNLNNNWLGLLTNYSTHYVADIPTNAISADYFGYIDKFLKIKLNANNNFVGIMSNGTSGDVNTFDFRQEKNYPKGNYEKSELIANEITDSIVVSLNKVAWTSNPIFRIANTNTTINLRKPSKQLLDKATETVRTTNFNALNTTDKASAAMAALYAYEIVKLNHYEPKQVDLPVQAIRLGEGTIGTLPGEFFSETGLKLKAQKPNKFYFTVSLANAMIGYVPPAAQFKLGGYETWLCAGSQAEETAEEKIYLSLLKLLNSVK